MGRRVISVVYQNIIWMRETAVPQARKKLLLVIGAAFRDGYHVLMAYAHLLPD